MLAGLGGSGKSRVALELAHRAKLAGALVWWVSVPQINSSMREVVGRLGVAEQQVEGAWRGPGSASDLAWTALNQCTQPWLLVFDNADEPGRLGPAGGQVADGTGWLRVPDGPHGTVVATSTHRDPDTWGTWSTVHLVPPLQPHDGATMLMDLTAERCGDYEQARLLSAELGHLPLALRAAADYLRAAHGIRMWRDETQARDFDGYRQAVRRRFGGPPGAPGVNLQEELGLEIVHRVLRPTVPALPR